MAHEQACPSRLLSSSPTHLSTHLAIIPSTQCSIRGTLPRTLEYSTAINAQGILPRAKRKGKDDHDGSGTIGQQRITWETPTVCSDRKQQPCMSTYTSNERDKYPLDNYGAARTPFRESSSAPHRTARRPFRTWQAAELPQEFQR